MMRAMGKPGWSDLDKLTKSIFQNYPEEDGEMEIIEVTSSQREEMLDITSSVARVLPIKSWKEGAMHLFCTHTTCGLTINEGADPDVRKDLLRFFSEAAPHLNNWRHMEGNTDAHIKSSLLGVSLLIPVRDSRLCLGRWQHIFLYEGDGPRARTVICQFLAFQ